MVEVYYYMPVNEVANAVDCGIKLSKWSDKEVELNEIKKKCISALLNPKDDIEKYNSKELKCLKLELENSYCYIADRYLYEVGKNNPKVMEEYLKSLKPIDEYRFGSFKLPECLVTSTVIGGRISIIDKRLDSPILFNSSEELYINNIIEKYKEEHNDFLDTILYYFYSSLAQIRNIDKIEDIEKNIAVFMDNDKGTTTTIKVPKIEEY